MLKYTCVHRSLSPPPAQKVPRAVPLYWYIAGCPIGSQSTVPCDCSSLVPPEGFPLPGIRATKTTRIEGKVKEGLPFFCFDWKTKSQGMGRVFNDFSSFYAPPPSCVACLLCPGRTVRKQSTRSGHEVERWRQSLQPGSLVDAMDPNNTWTNATVVDTRERLGAPVVFGVGPMGGGSAGECFLLSQVSSLVAENTNRDPLHNIAVK